MGIRGPTKITPTHTVLVEIGGISVELHTHSAAFRQLLEDRYANFLGESVQSDATFNIELRDPTTERSVDADLQVRMSDATWFFQRGDFQARWNPASGLGHILQSPSPYAIDSVLRIVHTLILATRGGFLVHAASAIRDDRAYLFAGVSGAGKTTISRLAPPHVTLLTDEVSYVRPEKDGYRAYGTPFAGELAKAGENRSAPLAAIFLLHQGPENRIESVDTSEVATALMRHILFFSDDHELVARVFHSACQLIESVPVRRLIFTPDRLVWEIIGKTWELSHT